MAELNFGLINQNLPGEIANSVQRGREDAVREKMAQQQLLSSQQQTEKTGMEMEQFKRRQAGLDQFISVSAQNGKTGDPEQLARDFSEYAASTGDANLIMTAQQAVSAAQERKRYNIEQGFAPAPAATAFGGETTPSGNMLAAKVAPASAPAPSGNMLAPAAAPANNLAAQMQTPADIQRRIIYLKNSYPNVPAANTEISLLTKELEEMQKGQVVAPGGALVRGGKAVFTAPERQDTDLIRNYNVAVKQGFVGSIFDYERKVKEAGRAPAQPRAEQPPVAVVDPVTGKPVYVSREQAMGMTPASAMESLPPKEIQRRESVLPQARQAVKTVSNTMSVIGKKVDDLLVNDKGIDGITGLIYGNTLAITPSARKALADVEQLKNLAFIQGITELRAASKTGAAVGNVSNKEGDRFENLKASLNRSQSKEDFINGLKTLKQQSELTSQFMRESFDETYSYKSNGGADPAAAASASAANSIRDQADAILRGGKK